MKKLIAFMISLLCLSSFGVSQNDLKSHKEVLLLMGTRFEITAIADSKEIAKKAVLLGIEEIERIEALISSWDPNSQTSLINNSAGKEVKVDAELIQLIQRSKKVSHLTNGAFDISFASMSRLYTFDQQEHELPQSMELKKAVALINYQDITCDLERSTIKLEHKGMRIGFGGIGKGYAANRAKKVMSEIAGIQGGLVNAAGDLYAWGENGKEEAWRIQIADPKDINKSLGWLNIDNMSVVTSGDYEKYFTCNGKRYAHIIDPNTGLATTGIKSATVICADTEAGDAIATSLFIMGPEKAIQFVDQIKNIEALIITDNNEIFTSKQLVLNKYQ